MADRENPNTFATDPDDPRIGHYFVKGYGGWRCIQAVPGIYLTCPRGEWLVATSDGHDLRIVGPAIELVKAMMVLDEHLARR